MINHRGRERCKNNHERRRGTMATTTRGEGVRWQQQREAKGYDGNNNERRRGTMATTMGGEGVRWRQQWEEKGYNGELDDEC